MRRKMTLLLCLLTLPCCLLANPSSVFYKPQYLAGFDPHYLLQKGELIFLLRLVIAVILGGLIGFSHSRRRRLTTAVSIRTFALVTLGSCAFASIACHLFLITGELPNALQIMGPIVSGIGFLCAAVIFKEGVTVHGLSTAAGIWTSATIGTACGAGLFGIALVTSILVVLLHRFDQKEQAGVQSEL